VHQTIFCTAGYSYLLNPDTALCYEGFEGLRSLKGVVKITCESKEIGGHLRILHTMLRVGNLERSLAFYRDVLGMRELRRKDYPEGRFTLAFVGYQSESESAVLELTHNWDSDHYNLGNAFGHIAIEVDDAYEACEQVRQKGGKVVREAGPMKHGNTVIAFAEDPDGYKIEFIQKRH